jgi:hypothetical protein
MKVKKACQLHPREILLSVKGSQANWATRLKDSLETSRWMNSKNLYGTCNKWNYFQWGEDANDSEYCELRDSPLCLDNVTHHQEWEWVMNNVMLIGRDSHYYVRSGGLSKDYKTAFEEALELAVEQIANEMGLGESMSDRLIEILDDMDDEPVQEQIPEVITRQAATSMPATILRSRTTNTETQIPQSKGKLRVIFWNANGWKKEKTEKIAQAANE